MGSCSRFLELIDFWNYYSMLLPVRMVPGTVRTLMLRLLLAAAGLGVISLALFLVAVLAGNTLAVETPSWRIASGEVRVVCPMTIGELVVALERLAWEARWIARPGTRLARQRPVPGDRACAGALREGAGAAGRKRGTDKRRMI